MLHLCVLWIAHLAFFISFEIILGQAQTVILASATQLADGPSLFIFCASESKVIFL